MRRWVLDAIALLVVAAVAVVGYAFDFDAEPLRRQWTARKGDGETVYIYGQAWGLGSGTVKFVVACRELTPEEVRSSETPDVVHIYDATEVYFDDTGGGVEISTGAQASGQLPPGCGAGVTVRTGERERGPGEWTRAGVY